MDDSGPTAITFVILFALLVIDMLVYGFGAALHNLRIQDLEPKTADDTDAQSDDTAEHTADRQKTSGNIQFLERTIDNPTEYVNTVQLLVFFLNMLTGHFFISKVGTLFEPLMSGLGSPASVYVSRIVGLIVLLYVFLAFGVLLPKKLARRSPLVWARICSPLIRVIMFILTPFRKLIELTAHGVMYLGGIRDFNDEDDVTEEEIRSIVSEGQEQGVIQDTEADMITNIFEFSDKEVRDIMTHRNDITGIDSEMALGDAITFMLQGNNSRFPVYLGSIDHIIGIVHIRDAMQKVSENGNSDKEIRQLRGLMRQPMYVPETRKIESLFHSMQLTKTQMAIVIDEYGQTTGLVSMEDILEEIVGNIMDEYDEDESYITPSGKPGEFRALGKTPIKTLEKRFDIDFHEEEFETLNGLLISKMDRIPEEGEQFDTDMEGYNFRIVSVQNHMITEVAITRTTKAEPEDAEYNIINEEG